MVQAAGEPSSPIGRAEQMIQRQISPLRLATKLPLLVVLLTLSAIGLVGLISIAQARAALSSSVEAMMTMRALDRGESLTAWVEERRADLALLAAEPALVSHVRVLSAASDRGAAGQGASAAAGLPPPDPSRREAVQAELRAFFLETVEARGYGDLFLFSSDGDLLFSAGEVWQPGTNVLQGAGGDLGLGAAVREALSAPRADVVLTDFAPQQEVGGEPAAFMAVAIPSEEGTAGVLAAQLTPEYITGMLLGESGSGSSLSLYLVGSDGLMRSEVPSAGRLSVLDSPPDLPHLRAVAAGEEGVVEDSIGLSGRSAMALVRPLDIAGVEWTLVEEIDEAEALAPLAELRRAILLYSLAAAGLCGLLGWAAARMVTAPLARLAASTRAVADRRYDLPIAHADRPDELGELATALTQLRDELAEADALTAEREAARLEQDRVVSELGTALSRLAEGDLTRPVHATFGPEYERLRNDVNTTIANLNAILATVVENAGRISQKAEEISSSSDDLSRRTENQAATLEQTAAALDELTTSVKSSAVGAAEVDDVVNKARAEAEQSGGVVRDAVAAMSEIERSSNEIGQIIGVIDDIAFQTNLLALNAGVEAARAGEAGKGFAVVASEVRTLAQRSSDAAKQIKTLIGGSAHHVRQGVHLVGRAGEALTSIVDRVAHISELVSDIATGAKEQATGLSEINMGVNQLDQVTQQNAAMVEQSTAASHALHQEARQLSEVVAQFRLRDAPRPAEPPKAKPRSLSVPQTPTTTRPAPVRLEATSGRVVADSQWDEF